MISTEFRRKSRQRLKQKLASINIKKSDTELIRFVMNQGAPVIDSENPQPYSVKGNVVYLNFHEAQKKVWHAEKRHITALGGTQSGKCVAKGTLILLANGKHKPIEEMNIDDIVLSLGDDLKIKQNRVTACFDNGVQDVIEIKTASCREIRVTREHPLYSKNGWVAAGIFFIGDFIGVPEFSVLSMFSDNDIYKHRIGGYSDNDIYWDRIKSIKRVGKEHVYDITVENGHNFIANDIFAHNTSIAPVWLLREIQQRGAGDYLFVSPSYPLLSKKALPEVQRLFTTNLGLGKYVSGEKKILTLSDEGEVKLWGKRQEIRTQIFFGHAQDPESLESATAKAAVLDEVGQKKFKLSSFEAIKRRLAIHQGRILMPTTPYYIGWLKKMFWDVWQSVNGNHPDIDIIRFRSIDNPSFPMSEYENAKATLPRWKFDMFYNALFTKAAGMIYDCFDEKMHVVPAFNIPKEWKKRYLGLDFGGINTAGIFIARDDSAGKLYIYREYLAGSRTAKQHKSALLDSEPITPISAGGSKSEEQWRNEFRQAGMGILSPLISDVEVGINAVYGAFKTDKLVILDSCPMLIDELLSYSRVLDDTGQPTEAIEDKNSYHLCDALRYIVPYADRQNNFKVGY